MTVPVEPVTVGGVLAIKCEIRNMEKDHEIRIYRATKTHTEQLTSGLYIQMGSSLEQRIFLSKRNTPGGVNVSIVGVYSGFSVLDQGE